MIHAPVAAVYLSALLAMLATNSRAGDASRGDFAHDVAPGKIAEECRKVDAGTRVAYAFEATAPVDFNIHFHIGKDVSYPEKQDAIRRVEATFIAGTTEEYCWMWSNRSATPIRVAGRLDPVRR